MSSRFFIDGTSCFEMITVCNYTVVFGDNFRSIILLTHIAFNLLLALRHTPMISAIGRLRLDDQKLNQGQPVKTGGLVRPCFKWNTKRSGDTAPCIGPRFHQQD